jgi:ubiquinone/menaquinone biosynthesis C-methylase UbiE
MGKRDQSGSARGASEVYALGSSQGETARLFRQAGELAADSAALLDRVGLRPGHSAIDLGCGPHGVLDLLAERVAPGGTVVGLDANPDHTAMAAQFAASHGLRRVETVTADARHTGLPANSFDLVHARTLLINVPQPYDVVGEMVRLARPGGHVAVMEPDTEVSICYPPHQGFDRIHEIWTTTFSRNGADCTIGRRVAELLRDAGAIDVGLECRTQMYPAGHSRRMLRADLMRSIWPQAVDLGLASQDELEDLDTAVRAHLADPRTVVVYGLLFLAWGRKPG